MKILLKRSQTTTPRGKPIFKLWAQLEFEGDEKTLVDRYQFRHAMLISAEQPGLIRGSFLIGMGVFVLAIIAFYFFRTISLAYILTPLIGAGAGWLYYDRNRETVYVRDLIHGRYFECKSIIELVRKEAWLDVISGYFRQVMESAKSWGGTEARSIEALDQKEAKYAVIRGL